MEVVPQEADRAPREPDGEGGDQELTVRCGDDEDRSRCDRGDARREAVHVVEEVERVRDADHPHHRHDGVSRAGTEQVNARPDGEHREARADFHDEPHCRAQAAEVVEQSDEREEHSKAEHAEELVATRHGRPDDGRDPDGHGKRRDDRQATQVGHGVRVAFVATGHVEHVAADREAQHEWREEQREAGGHKENGEVLPATPGHAERQYRDDLAATETQPGAPRLCSAPWPSSIRAR